MLVTPDARPVLLDFGLVTDSGGSLNETIQDGVVGTVNFMSPEQAAGDPELTPASDWYSVGVMLFVALTGRFPFTGNSLAVLRGKQLRPATPPRQIVPNVPADLDNLCVHLLERDPAARISGTAVLERLGTPIARATTSLSSSVTGTQAAPFTGRETELAWLHQQYEQAMAGAGASLLLVRGASGLGKSALVRRFLGELVDGDSPPVVLEGRCYERESVPYKAMDSVIDEFSRFWRRLPGEEAGRLLPLEPSLLPVLFPVLARVPVVARARVEVLREDPQTQRSRAFGALREVFARLGQSRRVALFLDDMQWADGDSATLLTELLSPPDAPRILVLLGSRDYAEEEVPALADLLRDLGDGVGRLELQPLSPKEGRELAATLLGCDDSVATRVATESDGNPLFISELAHYLQTHGGDDASSIRLEEIVRRRVAALPETSRRLLEVLAVAGEPVARTVVTHATELDNDSYAQITRALRAHNLARTAGGSSYDAVEVFHDRIRQAVVGNLTAEQRRRVHAHLAVALQVYGEADHESLSRHWRGAGDNQRAAEAARLAGRAAMERLEFDKAAHLFRSAQAWGQFAGDDERELLIALADALENSGRAAAAAEAFMRAAERYEHGGLRIDLRRRAVEQLLAGGHLAEGLAATATVLSEVGLALPRSQVGALARVLWQRTRLRMTTLDWTPRSQADIGRDQLIVVEACRAVGYGLGLVDSVASASFVIKGFTLAVRLGIPTAILRLGCMTAISDSALGRFGQAQRVLDAVDRAARQEDTPMGHGFAKIALAGIEYLRHNAWDKSLALADEAYALFAQSGRSRTYEGIFSAQVACWSLLYAGELTELQARVRRFLRDARNTGNRFWETNLRARFAITSFMDGHADRTFADVRAAIDAWLPESDTLQVIDHYADLGMGESALYLGERALMLQVYDQSRRNLARSINRHLVMVRVEIGHLLGRLALALAIADPDKRAAHLRAARKHSRAIGKEPLLLASQLSSLLEASILHAEGRADAAAELLGLCVDRFDASGTKLYAAAARRRLGQLQGGDPGGQLVARADDWLRGQNVREPARLVATLAPGFRTGD